MMDELQKVDMESVVEDAWQRGYNIGYERGVEEGKKSREGMCESCQRIDPDDYEPPDFT